MKKEITIRSSAAEYLTFVAATGENPARGSCVTRMRMYGLHSV